MFEEVGEYTLCEFEVIELVKDLDGIVYKNPAPAPDSPILVHVHRALPPVFPGTFPGSPCTPNSPYSPCSSPYSFLSTPQSPSSPACARLRRGRILCAADFRPLRILGRGGHGTVYLVADATSGRRLAMKVVAKNGLRLREYPAVFEEQAIGRALAARAGTQACVPLVGSFEDSDNFYFLTEYYSGGDLMHEVKRQGALSLRQARLWCAELLVALESLHNRGIIHRDVKLENILLDQDGHLALSDFGIARVFGKERAARPWKRFYPWCSGPESRDLNEGEKEEDGNGCDETHSLVGTPGYTAPEVYSGKYSYGVDVWGAGVVLYSMLMGKLPFGLQPREQRLEEVIARTDGLRADFDLDGFVDEDTSDLIMKMLEKNPEKRPSIQQLKKHRWFRGIKWNAIERRELYKYACEHELVQVSEEDIYIPYGRPYGALDQPPHEWFEWMSPSLRGDDDSWDTTNDWSLGSTCYLEHDTMGSEEDLHPADTSKKQPTVVKRMKGWLKKRMTSS